ncbi:MAG TPA: LysR family transcriptional regulator [Polyangiales bacterium]|nr:LysR family transcriptional regulator [Polyangiales bacterium]
MAVDYALLRTFCEVGATPNFAAVAARLSLTPTQVGQHIKQLEAQLGVSLLERVAGRLRLSEAGSALLPALQSHLAPIEQTLRELVEAREALEGTLTLAAPRSLARLWLRPRLLRLLEVYPALSLKVSLESDREVKRLLLEGRCELGLLVEDPGTLALELMPVHSEELLAVASPRYLARAGRLTSVQEFRAQRYIVYDASLPLHEQWWRNTFGAREPFDARVVAQIASLDEMLAFACAGVGIAVMPDHQVSEFLSAGALVALQPERARLERHPPSRVYLAWPREQGKSARLSAVLQVLLAPT